MKSSNMDLAVRAYIKGDIHEGSEKKNVVVFHVTKLKLGLDII